MKTCEYCGRANENVATQCVECTTEFASEDPSSSPEKFGPMISRRTKVVSASMTIIFVAILLMGLGGGTSQSPRWRSAVSFSTKTIPTSNGLSVVLSNQSNSKIVYVPYPPQIKSNGAWMDGPRPVGPLMMQTLAAHETATNAIVASLTEGVIYRVPIIWGCPPSLSQILRDRVLTLLNSPNAGLTLETTTNFTDELSLP